MPAEALRLALLAAAVTLTMMTALWAWHFRLKDVGIVDPGWSLGIGLVSLLYAVLGRGWPPRRAAVAAMGLVWSVRLTIHLARRMHGMPEEGRYQALRAEWSGKGANVSRRFLFFFLFQGLLVVFLLAWFVFALGSSRGVFAALCPALMYFLLRVTGIPATEERALRSRGEDYLRYQRTTSAFVP